MFCRSEGFSLMKTIWIFHWMAPLIQDLPWKPQKILTMYIILQEPGTVLRYFNPHTEKWEGEGRKLYT